MPRDGVHRGDASPRAPAAHHVQRRHQLRKYAARRRTLTQIGTTRVQPVAVEKMGFVQLKKRPDGV